MRDRANLINLFDSSRIAHSSPCPSDASHWPITQNAFPFQMVRLLVVIVDGSDHLILPLTIYCALDVRQTQLYL